MRRTRAAAPWYTATIPLMVRTAMIYRAAPAMMTRSMGGSGNDVLIGAWPSSPLHTWIEITITAGRMGR